MKKNTQTLLLVLLALGLTLGGCRKADFDSNYFDPERTTNATVEGLFAGLLNNPRVLPRYWNLFTFQVPMIGLYTQTRGFAAEPKRYEQAVNYTQDRWNDYYAGTVARLREMEKKYSTMTTDKDKAGYQLFMETGRIFYYDQTAQMVDLWGDIPFAEAGQLNLTGGQIVRPKYENGKAIYTFILGDLKRIADYLATATPDAYYAGQLRQYDYMNNGDLMKWRKYANSLRLRLAMRISMVDEAAAKAIVQEILANPSQYPVVASNAENIQITAKGPDLLANSNQHENGLLNGAGGTLAPGYMLDSVMKPTGDPRMQVLFSKNAKGEFQGVPTTWKATQVNEQVTANFFSRVDSTTFLRNDYFPGIILNASEVSFIRAEAYERWGGGTAKEAYEMGVRQSIERYYALNNLNTTFGVRKTPPTAAQVAAFLAQPMVAYGSSKDANLKKIYLQKWMDFGLMQNTEAWAEIRRTNYPPLSFPTDPGSTLSPNVPTRLLYPANERILNAENFAAVKDKDTVTGRVFWDVN